MWVHKSGQGIWENLVNEDTGEESVKEHIPKLVKQWCAKHRYSGEIPADRVITCLDCGQDAIFVVGRDLMIDGRVHKRQKS